MALAPGALLGSFEVAALVGAGRIPAWKIPLVVIPNEVRNPSSLQS